MIQFGMDGNNTSIKLAVSGRTVTLTGNVGEAWRGVEEGHYARIHVNWRLVTRADTDISAAPAADWQPAGAAVILLPLDQLRRTHDGRPDPGEITASISLARLVENRVTLHFP